MYEYIHKPKTRCISITVYDSIYSGKKIIKELHYKNLPLGLAIKYAWYFKYRQALLRVKYPHYSHERFDWDIEPQGMTAIEMERNRNKRDRTTCKRMITKCENAILRYENEQNELLIQDWEHEPYVKVKEKLKTYQEKLKAIPL